MPGRNLNLLSLDGGGVRGLSSLYILQRIMVSIDPEDPPKPCDYFDIIGGTSTGGLIAIMLGRLGMSIDECIKAYTDLSEDVSHKKRRIPTGIKGDLKERYDSEALELAVKRLLKDRKIDENALLKNLGATKVFVCCTSGETSETSLLRTWHTTRGDPDLYRTVRIWEAARATSAASTFFDSITIGIPGQRFLDGGTGANNPVRHMWGEATDSLSSKETLINNLGCLISIGTGQPGYKPFEETVMGIGKALLAIATETETTANQFHREQSALFENKTCFRFNVPRGLGDIGLAETEQLSAIKSMTGDYLQTEAVQGDLRRCVQQLGERQIQQPSTRSAGMILHAIEKVTQDEDHDFYELSQDTRWHLTNIKDDSRDLLDRISTYQPQRVHCKISMQKTKGTTHWIEKDVLSWVQSSSQGHGSFGKCLWIAGIVGCGKTFLANTAIQTLLDLENQGPVAHFYFDSNKHDSLTTEALLRSYVKQFLRYLYGTHSEPPRPIVDAIKRMFGSRTYQVDHKQLVGQLLKPLIQSFKGSFIVVDGLDLCSPQEYKSALDCFSSLLQDTSVKVIICGRDELDVTIRLPGSVELKITHEKTKDDLALFVKQYIAERNTKDGPISNNENTLARIGDALIDQAEGMLLWARLQIDVLWDTCTTDDQINFALFNLPKDLDETYGRCLERVEEKQQQYSLRVLRYVYEAKSPLTIDALGEALATDSDTGELKYGRIPVHTAILRSGANLVIFDEVERLVTPAHHSVRKFLESSRAPILEELELPVLDDAVLNIGEMCIAHLTWHTFNPDAKRMTRPGEPPDTTELRLPSMENMSKWIRPPGQMLPRLMSSWLSKRTQDTSSSIGSRKGPVVLTIPATRNAAFRLHGPFHSYARSNWISLSRGLTAASATWLQFERLVNLDLEDSKNEFRRGDSQMFPWKSKSLTPVGSKILGWAICDGHLPLLELGMRLQQDLTMPLDDYDGLLPLHLAARQGRVHVFLKVQHRIRSDHISKAYSNGKGSLALNVSPRTRRTALHYAAEQGHAEIIDLLLGSDTMSNLEAVEERDDTSRTSLRLAISSGCLPAIHVLNLKCGPSLWEHDRTESLLHALSAGGSLPEVVSYVMAKMSCEPLNLRDARVLTWVIKNNAVGLVPSLVKAGVSLDTDLEITPFDQVDRETLQTARPALFSALEASTPDLAFVFIENGANSDPYYNLEGIPIRSIDLALSRGWTSLAPAIYPELSNYRSYKKTEIVVQLVSTKVRWLSILTEVWIITGVVYETIKDHHPSSNSTSMVVGSTSQRCLYAEYQDDGLAHSLRISLECPESDQHELELKLMMGARGLANPRFL